jgi:hypothetical protein
MGQVTIYLDDDTDKIVKVAAKSAGVSKSKWIAGLIRERAGNEWPAFVRSLAGAWTDFPTLTEIRGGQAEDSTREWL